MVVWYVAVNRQRVVELAAISRFYAKPMFELGNVGCASGNYASCS